MTSVNSRPPPQYRERSNNDACGGPDNVNDGCQLVFPRAAPGLTHCNLCTKLRDPTIGTADKAELKKKLIQCRDCGICGTMVDDPCGTCRRAENYENGELDYEREMSANCRRSNLKNKLLHKANNANVGTVVPVNELQNIRAAQGFGSASQNIQGIHYAVHYECRCSDSPKQINQMLGTGVISFSESSSMLALRTHIVREVNGQWVGFYATQLLEDETSLRAPNNYVFPMDCLVMTLRDWYRMYSCPEYHDTYIVVPKQTARKGKANPKVLSFCVELYINVGQYAARTADSEVISAGRMGIKRKASAVAFAGTCGGSCSLNRTRDNPTSQPPRKTLRSLFIPDGDLLTKTPSTISVVEVRFKKTTCLISESSGSPTLLEESALLSGLLETRPLDLIASERGSTKDVFELRIGDQRYVAKKLVNLGGGRSDNIPVSKAVSVLTADLIRVKRMAYFTEKFKARASIHGVDIAEFDVSEAFLIKSYKPSSLTAPTAENPGENPGEGSADVEPNEEVSEVFLVEPLRLTTTVVKYSGTLGFTTRGDLRAFTVSAYAHYVAEQTACRYIFADIQGSNNGNANGKLSLTLFDPMTHTAEGTSGIGDHGRSGLQDFVSSHVCNNICLGLQLCRSEDLQGALDHIFLDEDGEEPGEVSDNEEEA